MNLCDSKDKQRLPQRLDKDYWIRLSLSNRRFEWLCQPVGLQLLYLPSLRGSTTCGAYITKVNQLNQNRKIETESNISFCLFKGTTETMVSVTSLGMGLLNGRRGYIVLHTRRKVAKKQYEKYSLDCKYETRRFNSSIPGEVLHKGERILSDIWNRNLQNPSFVNKRLWSVLKHDDVWISSFLKLAGNLGTKTPSTDRIQIVDFSLDKVMAIKKDLLNGHFQWNINRRLFIPKTDGKKFCSLTIANFKNRLVEEVLRRILVCIYEPCFNKHSHAFRSGRSCHTALRDVRKNFKGCKWILEGEISHFFNSISHTKLIFLLQKKIKDERFVSLISKGLKAKVLIPQSGEVIKPENGVSRSSILTPLLLNIYLHEFDEYMKLCVKEFNVGTDGPYSVKYRKISQTFKSRKTAKKLSLTSSKKLLYMKYVRYADDFIVGLICSRAKALEIKNRIKMFLQEKLNLELNNVKTLLIDVAPRKHFNTTSQVSFLGYLISMYKGINTRVSGNRRKFIKKGHVVLKVDQKKVVNKLAGKNFCTKDGNPIPKFTYIHDTQAVTNEKVNRLFCGIMNYYALADNIRPFGCRLYYIFTHSLAKMYAAKYRWHRRAAIFNMGGRDLSQPLLTKRDKSFLGRKKNSYLVNLKGIVYSHYSDMPRPDKASLNSDFIPSFQEIYNGDSQEIESIQELLKKYSKAGPV
jgi:group II intron reverse transcriptase/maturase